MIPVLYAEDAIVLQHDASTDSYSYAFPQNHGLGSLSEAISCKVVEERNGQYELEMEYPVTGKRFSGLKAEALIKAPHDDTKEQEFFRIYKVTKPMNGRVTVYARHFSYYLSKVVVMPFMGNNAALGPAAALRKMCALSMPRHGFTVSSDLTMTTRYEVKEPKTFRSIIGGSQESLIDTFAGEVEWKGSSVRLWVARNMGIDSGVVLKYGKNLTDLKATEDSSGIWTGIFPFWKGQYTSTTGRVTDLVTHADEPLYTDAVDDYVFKMVIPVDLTSEFGPDERVTKEALVEKARAYIQANALNAVPLTIDVSFVPLWQTEEYKSIAALERLKLCDTLTIRHERLGIDYTAKIIKVEYDVLRERYLTMTIGQAGSNFVESVRSAIDNATADVPTMSAMQQAIAHATELIQGGAGGHMVQGLDEDGKPHELYFMDTADVNTAMKVLRINMNGIGFSATGFNGPYHSAWTLDGRFVADYICAGSINASLIDAGVLNASLITAGVLKIIKKDEYGNPILDSQGKEQALLVADADKGELHIMADSFSLTSGETIQSIAASEASGAIQNLTQKQIFDILTNDSQNNGIHLINGVLYLDFSYAEGGTLKLGGENNGRGILQGYQMYGATRWSDNIAHELLLYQIDSGGVHFNAYGMGGYIDWSAGGGIMYGSAAAIRCEVKRFSTDSNNTSKKVYRENQSTTERRVIDFDADFQNNFGNTTFYGLRIFSKNLCLFAPDRLHIMRWRDPDSHSTTGYTWDSLELTDDGFDVFDPMFIQQGGLKILCGAYAEKWKHSWRYIDGSEDVTNREYVLLVPSGKAYIDDIDNENIRSYQLDVNHLHVHKTFYIENLGSGAYSDTTPVLAVNSSTNKVYTVPLLGSSRRYKTVGKQVTAEDIKEAYGINVYMAKYNPGYLAKDDSRVGLEWPMFVVEQMHEHLPIAVDMKDGQCETWNVRVIIPIMFQMIKDQKCILDAQQKVIDKQQRQLNEQQERIDSLEERIARLEEKLQ